MFNRIAIPTTRTRITRSTRPILRTNLLKPRKFSTQIGDKVVLENKINQLERKIDTLVMATVFTCGVSGFVIADTIGRNI